MRFLLVFLAGASIAVLLVAGRRGDHSRRQPIEVFPDMVRQLKLRPQGPSGFAGWTDGRGSRLPVVGTVPRTPPLQLGTQTVGRYTDVPAMTGRTTGATNFVDTNPLPITVSFLARGQQRFGIYCTPCHGATGDGNGVTRKFGMAAAANLVDQRIVGLPDGYLFHVITHGSPSGLMGPYAAVLEAEDRWAVVAYVRALELARLATIEDVPEDRRATLR